MKRRKDQYILNMRMPLPVVNKLKRDAKRAGQTLAGYVRAVLARQSY